MRGWQGSAASARPCGVMRPAPSSAPSSSSSRRACATCAAGGGVSQGRRSSRLSPHAAASSRVPARSASRISGTRVGAIRDSVARLQSR